jgi:hypothetical protein
MTQGFSSTRSIFSSTSMTGRPKMHDLGPRFRIGQPQCLAGNVDVLPLEGHDFAKAAAGQDQ